MEFRFEHTNSKVVLTQGNGRYYMQEFGLNNGLKSDKMRISKVRYENLVVQLTHLEGNDYKSLWSLLGDVPVNDDGEIETEFIHFEIGTDREDIWHWFEETFDISVGAEFF